MFKKKICMMLVAAAMFVPAAFAEETPSAETTAPAADAHDAVPQESATVDTIEGRMLLTQKLPYDVTYGNENALITITEYASLSCPHCRDFYKDVFVKVKENYIDTGKVRFVFRHYPLNINALRGAQVLECGVEEAKRANFLGAMFEAQPEWAFKEDEKALVEKLKSVAKIGGIDDSKFADCVKNKELEDAMLRQQLQTQKALGVSSTPTLYIGDKKYFDKKDYATFAKAIDDAFANIGKEAPAEEKPAEAAPAEEKKAE